MIEGWSPIRVHGKDEVFRARQFWREALTREALAGVDVAWVHANGRSGRETCGNWERGVAW